MVLVDPVPNQFKDQIVYLDFDGAKNVTYNGPVIVEGIDIPPFQAPRGLAGQESAIIDQIVAQLQATFNGTGISFTTDKPVEGLEYSTVFIGGDDAAFSVYGDFLGLSETIDVNNQNRTDKAFVFANEFGSFDSTCSAVNAIAHTIEHETGYLIGFAHEDAPEGTLEDFAYSGTVYWATRDFLVVANHHFMVISFSGSTPAWEQIQTLDNGSKALIVGGFEVAGNLETDYYNETDLQATNDWFTGGDSYGALHPEFHAVSPPSGLDFDGFSTLLYELTTIYDSLVGYELFGPNCASYVNTLMAKARVPEDEREVLGDFAGIDAGQDVILPSGHFSYGTGIDSSDYSVPRGADFTLTATTTATDAVANVNFYWDANGNGALDLSGDEMVGSDYYSANGWACDITTNSLAYGDHWFFAHAWDNQADYSKNYWGIQITITPPEIPPVADAGGPYSANEGSTVMLSASGSYDPDGYITSWLWDLDDDGQYDDDSGETVSFSRTSDGTYTLWVKVTDNDGLYDTDSATVTVYNVAPTADAGGPYGCDEGSPITLDASGSTDPGLDIISYAWDTDEDGDYDDLFGETVEYTPPNAGMLSIGVKVTDDDGAWDTDSAQITVHETIPGDANRDGSVNEADAQRLAEHWGETQESPTYTWWEMGDFDGDHFVGPKDAAILAANWGYPDTEAVEEPSEPSVPSESAVLIGPVQANRTSTARRLIVPADRGSQKDEGRSAKDSEGDSPAVQAVSDVRLEVVDSMVTQSLDLKGDSPIFAAQKSGQSPAAHDAVLAEEYGPPLQQASLQRQRLAWSHVLAQRQARREESARPGAVLAVDLLLLDESI